MQQAWEIADMNFTGVNQTAGGGPFHRAGCERRPAKIAVTRVGMASSVPAARDVVNPRRLQTVGVTLTFTGRVTKSC